MSDNSVTILGQDLLGKSSGYTGPITAVPLELWHDYSLPLVFGLGGLSVGKINVRGVILDISFLDLSTNLAASLPPWEEFPQEVEVAVVPGQPIEKDLPRIAFLSDAIRCATNTNRYYVDLRGSFDEYLKRFSRKSRHNLRNEARKFAKDSGGKLVAREFRSPEEMEEFLSLAREISKKTYQEIIGRGIPDSSEFRRQLIELAGCDLVRGYILFSGSQSVAYNWCVGKGNNLYMAYAGYDPAFRQWSPGTVLLYLTLEKLFGEQRFHFLDFGDAEYEYKRFFSTGSTRCAQIRYFRRTWKNLLLVGSHAFLINVSLAIGKIFRLLGVKDRIKRRLRLLDLRMRRRGQP